MADTRAERIEEAARRLCEHLRFSDFDSDHVVCAVRAALTLPPDPPRKDGWGALKSIVDHYEFAMLDCPKPPPDGPWVLLARLFAALHRLLADAPKEVAAAQGAAGEPGRCVMDRDLHAALLEAVEQLLASEFTEVRANYERSFADTDKLVALQAAMEAIHNG